MKTIYLVRHGRTENNQARTTGRATDPLSEQGMRQAEMVAEHLREVRLDALIASPYLRTQQTATAIAASTGLAIESHSLFQEVKSPSEIEGTAFADPDFIHIRNRRHELWGTHEHISDEENFYDVQARVQNALIFLEEHSAQHIVVATHGAFLRAIAQEVLLGELLTPAVTAAMFGRLITSNTGITVLQHTEAGWALVRWNDTTHLAPEVESR